VHLAFVQRLPFITRKGLGARASVIPFRIIGEDLLYETVPGGTFRIWLDS
jgi:hypothetical protein